MENIYYTISKVNVIDGVPTRIPIAVTESLELVTMINEGELATYIQWRLDNKSGMYDGSVDPNDYFTDATLFYEALTASNYPDNSLATVNTIQEVEAL